ncbi:phosphoadenosine phosphosulfate reductase family protein [Pontibacter silvestris]|uniref:Phosphoadenosine phosphosulfate reductase family protein n=1 Tax=Pontibacter silvestris TaxID=2305183 RepID=A0ABW4X211_9BACT|nr:phosphoadenosine phosphosulfate reductase family protein [Pontibacter silvestris]MCC9134981.1 phosphoadenosine phosphosulfate reductase family protein [Pontibacter silvestris]
MAKIRHVLGISGGKDSAALAIYMKDKYPNLDIEYYTSDTGKELDETYQLIENLKIYLGKPIQILKGAEGSHLDPFDHFLQSYGGYLPSSMSRWCTKKLKLEPFEKYVGEDLVVSYVGIRGDEDREGYISRRTNIQSIFPYRQNIWSEDVVLKFLNFDLEKAVALTDTVYLGKKKADFIDVLAKEVTPKYNQQSKLSELLNQGVKETNYLIFEFLKTTSYPLAKESDFPLLDNEDVIVRDDVFRILEESGVGVPSYYKKVDFEEGGKKGQYSRSRSGCYFCFFQQKIEWVWLYEQHPELYQKAVEYEKDGYNWNQKESLSELIRPERIKQIKEDYIKRQEQATPIKSQYLLDILDDSEGEGCAACFI